jgi:hypothetical protein
VSAEVHVQKQHIQPGAQPTRLGDMKPLSAFFYAGQLYMRLFAEGGKCINIFAPEEIIELDLSSEVAPFDINQLE